MQKILCLIFNNRLDLSLCYNSYFNFSFYIFLACNLTICKLNAYKIQVIYSRINFTSFPL